MTTITLPAEIEGPLVEAARKQGTTPETLALEILRRVFPSANTADHRSLRDFLGNHIGTLSGSNEALSENCGARFAAAEVLDTAFDLHS